MEKPIVISKIGSDHSFQGMNRQDFGLIFGNVKLALDGCSSGEFSEIGVGLFAQALAKHGNITAATFDHIVYEVMKNLVDGLQFTDDDLFKNFCFTILAVVETEKDFVVFSCGDGYAFTVNIDNKLNILNLDQGYNDSPPYFIYNLINPDNLSAYKDGVRFEIRHFPKSEFKKVGVGTDGYRFVKNLDNIDRVKIEEALLLGKPGRIGQVINRNLSAFKDDITIVM